MAPIVPVKEKKFMDVKLGELPSWILMWDFTPKGIAGAFQRGYYQYYNKYINVKKGGAAGVSMVLAAYGSSATAFPIRDSNTSGDVNSPAEGQMEGITEPDLHLPGLAPLQRILSTFISQSRIHIQ